MANTEQVQAQLAALRQTFIAGLPERLAALETGLAGWRERRDTALLVDLHRAAHSLTGAAATFGCDQLGQAARALEQCLASAQVASELAPLEAAFEALRQAVGGAGGEVYQTPELPLALPALGHQPRLVYILEEAGEESRSLALQLAHFGYVPEVFDSALALKEGVRRQRPAAMVVEITMTAGGLTGIEVVRAINETDIAPVPVIFVCSHGDFEARLEAVRAGGRAYFTKPLSVESLVDMVEQLTSVEQRQPYRVLIIDESDAQARFYAEVLGRAGMETEVVCDAALALQRLQEYSPELVLMDMYMPYCSGVELAAMIRQQPAYPGLPIVFLSTETDRHVQLEALRLGGDDFLTKPIEPAELVASVTLRAERYRLLRSRLSEDSLTGLLNHRRLMESLGMEMERIGRHGGELALVMLDIDHFSRVNERHGHAEGDRLIRRLARLLRQRLRSTDIIGRYGGDEFAVIMTQVTPQAARQVIEQIREHFAALEQAVGGAGYAVTLSAGIAFCPPPGRPGELRERAALALRRAKHEGRNRVVAGPLPD